MFRRPFSGGGALRSSIPFGLVPVVGTTTTSYQSISNPNSKSPAAVVAVAVGAGACCALYAPLQQTNRCFSHTTRTAAPAAAAAGAAAAAPRSFTDMQVHTLYEERHHHGGSGASAHRASPALSREAEEKEEDRLLEEEEFKTDEGTTAAGDGAASSFAAAAAAASPSGGSGTPNVLHAYQNDSYYYLPFSFKLVLMADHLERELTRLRYTLRQEPQFMVSTRGSGTVDTDRVLKKIFQRREEALAQTPPSPPREGEGGTPAPKCATPVMKRLLQPPSLAELAPYTHWCGSSFAPLRALCSSRRAPSSPSSPSSSGGAAALVTLTEGVDHIRRMKSLHTVGNYQKLNLRPRKQLLSACLVVAWNSVIGVANAATALVCMTVRGAKGLSASDRAAAAAAKSSSSSSSSSVSSGKLLGTLKGLYEGTTAAVAFLFLGCVLSPVLHLTAGAWHSVLCVANIFTSHLVFDPRSGRWERNATFNLVHFRREWQLEKRVLRAVGRQDFKRGKLKTEKKWNERFASMGFNMDTMREKLLNNNQSGGGGDEGQRKHAKPKEKSPYDILGVPRNATQKEIKRKYKTLAMIYHPDVASQQQQQQQPPHAADTGHQKQQSHTFEDISTAYQVLSNPEKRKAYDVGGQKGLDAHEQQYGSLHLTRTPEEIVQYLFGGNAFRHRIFGEVLRSHWSLKFEAQVSVTIHDFEILQSIRTKQVALELVKMVDVHAQRPYSPYVPRHADGGSGAHSSATATAAQRRVVRKVQMGGLPDPITGQRAAARPLRGGGGGHVRAGAAASGVDTEVQQHIQQELGGGGGGSGAGKQQQQAAAAAAAAAAARSPFDLHPGSNLHNCFSHDFEDRVDRLVDYLAKSCFGPELLYEVGEAYVVHAQRYLGIRPFYASKWQVWRKVFTGLDKMWHAATLQLLREDSKTKNTTATAMNSKNGAENANEKSPRKKGAAAAAAGDVEQQQQRLENARRIIVEYVGMEFDSVVADFNVILKNATQIVLKDTGVSEEVRQRRCYALWYIGTVMQRKGRPWHEAHSKENKKQSDLELIAYVQQAATAPATTAPPPAF